MSSTFHNYIVQKIFCSGVNHVVFRLRGARSQMYGVDAFGYLSKQRQWVWKIQEILVTIKRSVEIHIIGW